MFVDFENMKSIDPAAIGGKSVTLHLFLGPQNRKLDVEVVERLLEHAQAVKLVRSPKAGKNALDFVLVYHVGQAVLADPKGYFHIMSKDTGFDALVDFLTVQRVKVKRHDDWSTLHFTSSPKPAAQVATGSKPGLSVAAEKLLENLRKSPRNRPKKLKTLSAHAMNYCKEKPDAAGKLVEELKQAGFVVIGDKDAVSYRVE